MTGPGPDPARLDALRAAIAQLPPGGASAAQLEALGACLAALAPEDVGLARHAGPLQAGGRARGPQGWWSVPILESPLAELSLFLLPAGAVIPRHDHPDMHVWSRLLLGRVRVEAWDWVAPPPSAVARPAGVVTLEPGAPPLHLDPLRGNVHQLTAEQPSALLDLFAPPYDLGGARPCRYWGLGPREPDGPRGPDGPQDPDGPRDSDDTVRLLFLRQA